MAKLKGNPHSFGFKPFGATNRAVVLSAANTGALPITGSGLNLGTNWELTLTVRRDANAGAAYVFHFMKTALYDGLAIFYDAGAGTYALYCPPDSNPTGTAIYMLLTVLITDLLFHDVKFTYVGSATTGTVYAFLDGAPAGTLDVANFAPVVVDSPTIYFGYRPQQTSFAGAISQAGMKATNTMLVNLLCDEASGNALNTGTLGGEMAFTDGGTRELV